MADARRTATVALLTAAVDAPLTYTVPDALASGLAVGSAVVVPLRNRLVSGVAVELGSDDAFDLPGHAGADARAALKPVHALLDDRPVLNAAQLGLARWISEEYAAPLGRACALMVPPGFTPRTSTTYSLAAQSANRMGGIGGELRSAAERVGAVLQRRGAMVESALTRALGPGLGARDTLHRLVELGVLETAPILQAPTSRPMRATLVQLVVSPPTVEAVAERLREPGPKPAGNAVERRVAALRYLQSLNGLGWADWLQAETGATRADLHWLAQRGLVLLGDAERWRDPLSDVDYVAQNAPPLTTDQERAWSAIRERLHADPAPDRPHFLLRGVTGSGKTEIYMRAVETVLSRGEGAIVLVPEISLTPQTARRFLERFPGKVALVHSRLSSGERFDTWRRIRDGSLPLVVGARSALFAPLSRLGLIVLDEEHDGSYKQSSSPYYDARRVALNYAGAAGATLILGSATPSLEALWRVERASAQAGEPVLRLLELPNRVRGHVNRVADQAARLGVKTAAVPETETVVYQPLPSVHIVDMRAELRGGNAGMFSGALQQALAESLARGEQAILFLNRRGAASCVLCRDCGQVMRCPNDDTPLTLHVRASAGTPSAGSSLRCHQCNHAEAVPSACPSCSRPRIRFIGIGTQRIEQAIHEQFPKARAVRWDRDTASGRSSADQILKRFVDGQADVLIGTQMIAKGLDLPRVTVVGVVLADVGLFLPDFRAAERVFQLIEQVAGRAGRGLLPGRVIVQTYNPDHPAISFARAHDVIGFARHEMAQRKRLGLPPFTRLVRFEVSADDEGAARSACETIARKLRRRQAVDGDVIGPAPAYFARRNKQFRWQVMARTSSPRLLTSGLDLPRGVVVDVDPVSVL